MTTITAAVSAKMTVVIAADDNNCGGIGGVEDEMKMVTAADGDDVSSGDRGGDSCEHYVGPLRS